MKVLQINLQNCEMASLAMSKVLLDLNIDIALIQEPFQYYLKGVIPHLPNNYKLFHKLQEARGGALIAIKKSIQGTVLLKSSHSAATIEFQWGGERVFASSIYTRPVDGIPPASKIRTVLHDNPQIRIPHLLVGIDANARNVIWNSRFTDKHGEDLAVAAMLFGLNILNKPVCSRSMCVRTAFIDVSLIGDQLLDRTKTWSFLDIPSSSDHPYIYFEISVDASLTPPSRKHAAWLPKEEDVDLIKFQNIVAEALHNNRRAPSTQADIDTEIKWLTDIITRSARTCKKSNIRPLVKKMPWWDRNLYILRNNMRKAGKQLARDPSQENIRAVNEHRRVFQQTLRQTRLKAVTALRTEFSNRDPFGALNVLKGARLPTIDSLQIGDTTTADPATIAAELGEHFFAPTSRPFTPTHLATIAEVQSRLGKLSSPAEYEPITQHETSAAFKSIKKRKSAGLDGIQGWQILTLQHILQRPLTSLFNVCLQLAYFPADWKVGRIVFLSKPGRDQLLPTGYRPISILPLLGKMLERIVKNRIMYFARESDWLSDAQHGFMPGRSTITAASTLIDYITHSFHGYNGWETLACMIDIQGAFDNAWHPAIVREMLNNGCPTYITKLTVSFLENRSAVINNGGESYPFKLTQGCPQGSVLSPLLWNILLNGALRLLESTAEKSLRQVRVLAYADDVTLYAMTKNNNSKTTTKMQAAIDLFRDWLEANRLSAAPNKTELILFSKRRNATLYDTNITINMGTHVIAQSLQVRFLGLKLDRRLNWTQHINEACLKTRKACLMVTRLARKTWGTSRHTLQILYSTAVTPILTYASEIWGHALSMVIHRRKIRRVQRLMSVGLTRCFHTISGDASCMLANWLPLDQKIQLIGAKRALAVMITAEAAATTSGQLAIVRPERFFLRLIAEVGITSTAYPRLLSSSHQTFTAPLRQVVASKNPPCALLPPWNGDHVKLVPDTSGTDVPLMHPSSVSTVHVFTDGSRLNDRTGAGTLICTFDAPDVAIKTPLPDYATVFEAEVRAIVVALEYIKENLNEKIKTVKIFSDSRAALLAISSKDRQFPDVINAQSTALLLCTQLDLRFVWVKAHTGTEGNERADVLAKEATKTQPQRTAEQSFTSNEILRRCRTQAVIKWNTEWAASTNGRWTFRFIASSNQAKKLDKLAPNFEMFQVLSGHSNLNNYLYDYKASASRSCACGTNEETTEHFLFHCPRQHHHRIALHNTCVAISATWPPTLSEFIEDRRLWRALCRYVKLTKRLADTRPAKPPTLK